MLPLSVFNALELRKRAAYSLIFRFLEELAAPVYSKYVLLSVVSAVLLCIGMALRRQCSHRKILERSRHQLLASSRYGCLEA